MKRDMNYNICWVKFTTQNSICVKFVTNSMSALSHNWWPAEGPPGTTVPPK